MRAFLVIVALVHVLVVAPRLKSPSNEEEFSGDLSCQINSNGLSEIVKNELLSASPLIH